MADIKANYHEDEKDPQVRIFLLENELRMFEAIASVRSATIATLFSALRESLGLEPKDDQEGEG